MIKEITQTTRDKMYTYVRMSSDDTIIGATMTHVESDIFVEDDYFAETSLHIDLVNTCEESGNIEVLPMKKLSKPEEVSKFDYYNDIVSDAEMIAELVVYKNTMKFKPNFIMCSSAWLPILRFSEHFKMSPPQPVVGPYIAGTYKQLPVIVTPVFDKGEMMWGVNDKMTPGVVTFINEEEKICNKIANPSNFVLIKLED